MPDRRLHLSAALIAILAACGTSEPHRAVPTGPPVVVKTALAREATLPILYRTSGTVRGRTTVTVTSKTAGHVRAVHVAAADHVTAGQLLVELEANDVRAGVSRARAELDHASESKAEAASGVEAARVAAKLAETSRDRVKKLFDGGAVTRQEFDEAESKAQSTAAQLQMAEARLRAASSGIDVSRAALAETQATLDYARVVAPFTGRVVERRVDPGTFASPGSALFVLDDEATLRVETAVEESRGAALALGDQVTVEVNGTMLAGTIGELSPAVDIASRAFVVKIDLRDPSVLRPGTFARVGFHVGTQPRLVVPSTAITTVGALERVFVADGGVARLRMITIGEAQAGLTEVLSGLSAGEVVVVEPAHDLRDGTGIEVRP
jgi:RND family efflux transporter MFP subunit